MREAQRHPQRACDGLRDVLLNGKNVCELTVVILRPELGSVIRLDELRGDAQRSPAFRTEPSIRWLAASA